MGKEGDDDRIKHAADDPTAMWDDGAVEEALKSGKPPAVAAPTPAATPTPPTPAPPPPATQPPGGLSWAVTIALAAAVGVVVYFLVRAFR